MPHFFIKLMNNQSQIEIHDFHKPSPVITGLLLPVHNGMILLLIWISFKVQKAVLKTLDRLGSRHINTIIKTNVVNLFVDLGIIWTHRLLTFLASLSL